MSIADILKAERDARERADNRRAAQAFTPTSQQPAIQSANPYGSLYATVDPNLAPSDQPLKSVTLPASVQRVLGIAQAPLPASMRDASMPTEPAAAREADTSVPDLSALKEDPNVQDEPEQQGLLAQEYIRGLAAGRPQAPTFRSYTPKVFELDPEIEKERDQLRADIEQRRIEIQDMEETDRLVQAREQKTKAAERLRAAEKIVNEYRPTDRGPLSTTGSKVAAAIAIALGEAARGFRGGQGRNVGMDLINQAIDREAKRQQDEYNRLKDRANFANNVYARAFQEFGDANTAFETAKTALWNRAYQTANIQLDALKGSADADRFLKDAKNNAEVQKARNQAALNQSNAAAFAAQNKRGVSDSMQLAAAKGAQNSAGLVKEFKEARALLGKLKSEGLPAGALNVIAAADKDGISLQLLTKAGAEMSEEFQGLINFYNRINALAFGQAAEGQAASSISNKDVAIFRNLLANPVINREEIGRYLGYLQDKASANAVFNQVLASGEGKIQDAMDASNAYMIRLGYKQSPDGSFSKGDFDYNRSANLARRAGRLLVETRVTN